MALRALGRPASMRSLRGAALAALCAAVAREAPNVTSSTAAAHMMADVTSGAFRDASGAENAAEAFDAVVAACTRMLPAMSDGEAMQVLVGTMLPVMKRVASQAGLDALHAAAQARVENANEEGVTQGWQALLRRISYQSDQTPSAQQEQLARRLLERTSALAPVLSCPGPQIALWGVARSGLDVPADTRRVLLDGVARCAPELNAQQLTAALAAMAQLGDFGGPGIAAALDAAIVRTAPKMDAVDLTRTLVPLGSREGPVPLGVRKALHGATARLAPDMDGPGVATALVGLAGLRPQRLPWPVYHAMREAIVRVAEDADANDAAQLLFSFNRLNLVSAGISEALRDALVRAQPHFDRNSVITALRSLAVMTTETDMSAAAAAAVRALDPHIDTLFPAAAANVLLAYAMLRCTTEGLPEIGTERLLARIAPVAEGGEMPRNLPWQVGIRARPATRSLASPPSTARCRCAMHRNLGTRLHVLV
jgi:hypothetical protein